MIYFDNAATSPIDPEVVIEMTKVMKENFGNPSSIHSFGREARVIIEDARSKISSFLNVSPSEIFFTSGGTEAINLIIRACIIDLKIENVITSNLEHHAVFKTLDYLKTKEKFNIQYVNYDKSGRIDIYDLKNKLKENPKSLVVLMHANNEIGNLLPIKKVGEFCKEFDSLFFSDTVQTMGKFENNFKKLNLDFAACSAHKLHGPKGIGFVYINGEIKINPIIFGGGQERNMRSGTENIYGITGMAKAFEIAYREMKKTQDYLNNLKLYMISELKKNISSIKFNGECETVGLPNIISASFPENEKAEMLLMNLDISGVAVSGGSACTSGTSKASHVLNAIDPNNNDPTIRFSFSKFNTKDEIDKCVSVMVKVLQK
ncbi:MAG: cysteine desulfurase [Bacteroidales bacterium]|nr:cysteine desulfurase [Bacteroidales bacterium]